MSSTPDVYLKCIKVGSKLRVRITSAGYLNDANCRFPRHLRTDGAQYKCSPDNVSLITSRNKYYYMIAKAGITVIGAAGGAGAASAGAGAGAVGDELNELITGMSNIKIYEDTCMSDCAICLTNPKDTVINPCGHFYMCATCAVKVKTCPICRGKINLLIPKSSFGLDDD